MHQIPQYKRQIKEIMNDAGDGTYSKILSFAEPQLGQTGNFESTTPSYCSSLSVFEINIFDNNLIHLIYFNFTKGDPKC